MNKGKTIFSQIMSLIPERDFKTCVDRYKGNYRARNFSCKDQFPVMSYAQLTGRDSLRDIENCLTALSSKLYHCGISYAVPRNTLAKANEKRDWHIYKDFADVLLKKVRPLYIKDKFRLDLDNMVYAFDSSTISLCLKLCPSSSCPISSAVYLTLRFYPAVCCRASFPMLQAMRDDRLSFLCWNMCLRHFQLQDTYCRH